MMDMETKTTPRRPAPIPDPSSPTIGNYMRAKDLTSPAHVVTIDNRPAAKDAPNGANPGRYGIDIPVTVDGTPFIVTVPTWSAEYVALYAALGEDLDDWTGRELILTPNTARGFVNVKVA